MTAILIVEDDDSMGQMLVRALSRSGNGLGKSALAGRGPVVVQHARRAQEALAMLDRDAFDAVVTDLNMPGMDGIALSEHLAQLYPDIPVIMITAFGTLDTAIRAIRAGAYDLITKPFEVDQLEIALSRAVERRALREEVKRLRAEVRDASPLGELLGSSGPMRALFSLVERVAFSDVSVLIHGETGTGKELVARAIHQRSDRAQKPFVTVNCAAVPEALLESELFGHVKGAFTDAKTARRGLFQQAQGGTIFLDEIGDMPMALQPKLLRVLQERKVRPVGSDEEISVDVRILAATHRDLEALTEERTFREDLYYRLAVVTLPVPPLRARGNDILLLAQHYLDLAARRTKRDVHGISPEAAEKLLSYPWPGNVRELVNCIERAVTLTPFAEIAAADLPPKVREHQAKRIVLTGDGPEELVPMDEIERRYVVQVMEAVQGNKSQAASVLGWDRKRLYRKLEKYGLSEPGEGGA